MQEKPYNESVSQEPRPAAWVEDLTLESKAQVKDCLRRSKLLTTSQVGGLEVEGMGKERHLAVRMAESGLVLNEEGWAVDIERAEVVLREAGFALILTRRKTQDGWLSPWLQIYGKSAVGPGP